MKLQVGVLQPDVDAVALRECMARFGPVGDGPAVRDGDPQRPWAIGEMALGVTEATEVARRIDGIHHVDRFIRARVMLHG